MKKEKLPGIGYSVLPVLEEMMANDWLSPTTEFFWGGGEPTILPEYEAVQSLINDFGGSVLINSSGVRYSEALAAALETGCARLVCSVDAGARDTYRKVKGVDRFDVVWENLARYSGIKGADIGVKYILLEENIDEVDSFILKAEAAGIKKIICDLDHSTGIFKDPGNAIQNLPAPFFDALVKLRAAAETREMQVSYAGMVSLGEVFLNRIGTEARKLRGDG